MKTFKIIFVISLLFIIKGVFAQTPTTAPSNVTFSNVTNTSMTVSWTRGNGSYILVTVRPTGNSAVAPTFGVNYSSSTTYGSGSNLGSSNYVVYKSTGTSVTITGLTPGTRYSIAAYEYNILNVLGTNLYYYGSASPIASRYMLSNEPTTQTTNVAASNITGSSITASWTNGNGSTRIVVVNSSSNSWYYPDDAVSYVASATYGSGSNLGGANYVVYIGTGTSVNITNLPVASSYYVRVYEYNSNSTYSQTYNYNLSHGTNYYYFSTVNNAPTLSAISNITVCQNTSTKTINLTGIGTGGEAQSLYVYAYSNNTSLIATPSIAYTSANNSGTLSFTPVYGASGKTSVTVYAYDGGSTNAFSSYRTFTITVNPLPVAATSITGNFTICSGKSASFSTPTITNATSYQWYFNGTYTTTATNSINSSLYSSNYLYVQGVNDCGGGNWYSKYLTVVTSPSNANAGADQTICTGTTALSANTPAVGTGQWLNLDGTAVTITSPTSASTNITGLIAGQHTRLVWAVTNANYCVSKDTIRVSSITCPLTADFYASNVNPCTGSANITFFDNSNYVGSTTFSWNFGAGATPATFNTTGTSCPPISVTYTTSGFKNVSLQITNGGSSNNSKSNYINVGTIPSTAGAVSGIGAVCQGVNGVDYSISAITNATNYNWTLPSGSTLNTGAGTNAITVNFSPTASTGIIKVRGVNGCGNGTFSPSYTVTVNLKAGDASSIVGSTTVCQGSSAITYTIPTIVGATTYNWRDPSGVLKTTSSNTISINYANNATSGYMNVYGSNANCADGAISPDLLISVNPLPDGAGFVSGSAVLCQGESAVVYTVPTIINANSYAWNLPSGSSINTGVGTNSITVDFSPSALSGNITVSGLNACGNGNSSEIYPIVVNTKVVDAGTVSGSTTVCQGTSAVYVIPTITGATSYVWTTPDGEQQTITSNTISISFDKSSSSGNLSVYGTNANCGNGISSVDLAILVNPLPDTANSITGTSVIKACSLQKGVAYSTKPIDNATSYSWTLPSNVTVVSGLNDTIIKLNFNTKGTSGSLSVAGVNSCGSGTSSNNLTLSFVSVPTVSICYVTVDTSFNYNEIAWRKPSSTTIDSFIVYRKVGSKYTRISSVPYGVFSSVIDTDATPNTNTHQYKISLKDSCGNESALSDSVQTIFMQASVAANNGGINLSWTPYVGIPFNFYYILIDTVSNGNFIKLDSASNSTTSRTVLASTMAKYPKSRYAIGVDINSSCTPTAKRQAASINTTRSNIKTQASIVGSSNAVLEYISLADLVTIYPNPSNGTFNVNYPLGYNSYKISITNINGQLVYSESFAVATNGMKELSINNLPKGFYTLRIDADSKKAYKKLVIE